VAAPLVTMTALVPTMAAAAPVGSSSAPAGVPDWPLAAPTSGGSVPDWPAAATADVGRHVVLRGECLWQIAADHLRQQTGSPPPDAAIARAVRAWWSANADVIGPNPDLLLPGQVLQPPP
jgi:nucleoid-associated protein YgaU